MESLKELNSRRDDGNEREMVEDDDEEQKKGGDRNRLSSPVEGSESSSDLTPERVSINAERLGQLMYSMCMYMSQLIVR